MIKEIAQYIENKTTFIIGDTLYAGFLPQNAPDLCTVIIESGGNGNYYLTDRINMTMQVLSRGLNYYEANNQASIVYWLFVGGRGITLPEIDDGVWVINASEAIQIPQSIGQDDKGRFEFSTNYILRISRP